MHIFNSNISYVWFIKIQEMTKNKNHQVSVFFLLFCFFSVFVFFFFALRISGFFMTYEIFDNMIILKRLPLSNQSTEFLLL